MGRKSNLKKQKKSSPILPVAAEPMNPSLMKAFVKGRDAGFQSGKQEGKVEGLAEMMMLFSEWTEVMDQHIKGIGPKKKMEIQLFFADRIKESIQKNKLNNGKVEILHDGTDQFRQ